MFLFESRTHALASTSQENKRVVPTRVALKNKSKKIKVSISLVHIDYGQQTLARLTHSR